MEGDEKQDPPFILEPPLEASPIVSAEIITPDPNQAFSPQIPIPTPDPSTEKTLFPDSEAPTVQNTAPASEGTFAPFHLTFDGVLDPYEKEKLLDILKAENVGIGELDLEPQFDAHQVRIPRVSEYTCVRIIQELRSARGTFRVYPSEEIERGGVTPSETQEPPYHPPSLDSDDRSGHIPILSEEDTEGEIHLDALLCTTAVETSAIEAPNSHEVIDAIDALKAEMRAKAKRIGATRVIRFRVELVRLADPTIYRVIATGTAVKPSL